MVSSNEVSVYFEIVAVPHFDPPAKNGVAFQMEQSLLGAA